MNSEEIRLKFFEFFQKRGHKIVPSSSLFSDDPSVLLTTAGMQQFKKYYTDELDALEDFGSKRIISIQKCFRASDIEEVGDKTHLTFFEMLGNFSFKDYFKQSAILWAYEFIVDILKINSERVTVSVFKGDDKIPLDEESFKIWNEKIGIPKDKIILGEKKDNFWGPTGDEGPCGPSSEIYIDGVEIWNLVFNEYYKEKSLPAACLPVGMDRQGGVFKKTNAPGVDTGMGLERLTSILAANDDVFETDLLKPLFSKIKELAPETEEKILRILTDHLRASIFLIVDGIRPSNKEAGYILRRLLRRILAYQIKYDIHADLFPESVEIVKKKFGKIYPKIKETKIIMDVMESEAQKFQATIAHGIKEIEKCETISGKKAFYLYETFGLPFELIKELSPIKTKDLKREDFDEEFEKHRDISRAGVEKKFGGHGLILNTGELKAKNEEEEKKVIRLHTATHLLQWALIEVLGKNIRQTGSDITAERTRFDFSFDRKLTSEEIKKIENLVNQKIKENLPVYFKEMPKTEAEKTGALSFFKAKYPEIVKVYFIGPSIEFCGGPHVKNTSEIGNFKIIKEESTAAGIRRIRATVGE